jgi:hypothetical protein
MNVIVYNGSGQPHNDRFDGKDYSFPAGESVVVPVDAAIHIFGMGMQDRSKKVIRLGWAFTGADMPAALERLDTFLFEACHEEEEDAPPQVVNAIERPTIVPKDDALLSSVRGRTRAILQKAS